MEELKPMEEGRRITEKDRNLEGEGRTALEPWVESLPAAEFVKVEKNLASLGFFTPSSKRLRNAQEKSFTITTVADGQRLEVKGTIIPSAKYGLPITADQDKWIALCKILGDIIRKEGRVTNPVCFTSAEILRLLHKHRHSGKNYHEIEEWLDVLFSTTIFSEGVVYLAGEKRRVKDRFRVFDRAVSFGKELSDGKLADKNYVWFSDWQLQNINNNYLLPIDLEAYRELKNHIAKALVPLLQVWLYATRDEGVFEKRYDELCQFLNIQQYRYLSLITRTLGPSLDELKQFGYLADWRIAETSDGANYKIVFYHGEKFHRDRNARLTRKKDPARAIPPSSGAARHAAPENVSRDVAPAKPIVDPALIAELTGRGIREEKATQLLANLKPGQDVIAQLEHADHMINELQGTEHRVTNPAGFYVRMIEWNTPVPDGFETSAKRKLREDRERRERERQAAEEAQRELDDAYETYCSQAVEQYIAENPEAYAALREAKLAEERELHPSAWPDLLARTVGWAAKYAIRKQLNLPSFEEFVALKQQGTDFSLKPVGSSPAVPESGAPPLGPSPEAEAAVGTTPANGEAVAAGELPVNAAPEPAPLLADATAPEAPAELPSDGPVPEVVIELGPAVRNGEQRQQLQEGENNTAGEPPGIELVSEQEAPPSGELSRPEPDVI